MSTSARLTEEGKSEHFFFLLSDGEDNDELELKGGTSLSKGFGVIHRSSKEIVEEPSSESHGFLTKPVSGSVSEIK